MPIHRNCAMLAPVSHAKMTVLTKTPRYDATQQSAKHREQKTDPAFQRRIVLDDLEPHGQVIRNELYTSHSHENNI